ncbi:MAG TPA: hypothetical protein VMF89_24300, partial [Polyangiales bacterium]|nr:hypothetical protein [Polyangiales bacterium]
MVVSSGAGASVQPSEVEVAASYALPWLQIARPAAAQRTRRGVAVRCGILVVLALTYRGVFSTVHGLIGNPTFLLGQVICLVAAAWLGVRGALVAIVSVALIDRSIALSLPASFETGETAGFIALLVKVVLAGGLGLAVDSRRRALALNVGLRREIEARERSEASLRHSESMQRALVESLGEGVGLFDAQDRLVFANRALPETLGVARA